MEQYFESSNVGDDSVNVTTTIMYLAGDAKV